MIKKYIFKDHGIRLSLRNYLNNHVGRLHRCDRYYKLKDMKVISLDWESFVPICFIEQKKKEKNRVLGTYNILWDFSREIKDFIIPCCLTKTNRTPKSKYDLVIFIINYKIWNACDTCYNTYLRMNLSRKMNNKLVWCMDIVVNMIENHVKVWFHITGC